MPIYKSITLSNTYCAPWCSKLLCSTELEEKWQAECEESTAPEAIKVAKMLVCLDCIFNSQILKETAT